MEMRAAEVSQRDLWYGTSGPHDAKIVFVAESWGQEELAAERPLVGSSGIEFDRMLAECGIQRDSVFCTNMVSAKPNQNETWRFFVPKVHKPNRIAGLAPSVMVQEEIRRLYRQILAVNPKVVVAIGAWSAWALSKCMGAKVIMNSNNRTVPEDQRTWGPTGIMNWRGSMWYLDPHREFCGNDAEYLALKQIKLLFIIHPAAILREWYLRAPTIEDLRNRIPLALNNDWRPYPEFTFFAPPTFDEARSILTSWLSRANAGEAIRLASDIETLPSRGRLLVCSGFADSDRFAMSIPWLRLDADRNLASYWTPEQEAELVHLTRATHSHPRLLIEGQNFIYDTQYYRYWMGVTPKLDFDTMLAQNVLFPGTPKGLDYLSSLYVKYHWFWKEDSKEWDQNGSLEQLLAYNCLDCVRTWECAEALRQIVAHYKMEPQMKLKMRINELCLRMMNRGVKIDVWKRGQMLLQLHDYTTALETELLEVVPQSMVWPGHKTPWYNSPKQTKILFHDVWGLKEVLHRKTKNPTVGKEGLMQLKKWYPEFTPVFNRLDELGSASNTADVIQMQLENGRAKCSFNPGGTETHRLSSSKNAFGGGTNLQNLTKGEEDE